MDLITLLMRWNKLTPPPISIIMGEEEDESNRIEIEDEVFVGTQLHGRVGQGTNGELSMPNPSDKSKKID